MNSAISNLRPHYSQIVKFILFFYSGGAHFLFFLLFLSFSFPFLPCLSFLLWANHFSALSLSRCSTSLPPSLMKPRPEHQAKLISIAVVSFYFFFFFFFLVCDLMVDSAVVEWVMDLVFWVISRLGFRFGHILVGLWFGFRWWVCDLVLDGYGLWWASGGGYLFDGFLRWTGGGWWWVGMSFMVWFWVCDLILGLFFVCDFGG